MTTLFDRDPAFAQQPQQRTYLRLHNGRFATPQQQRTDAVERENRILRTKVQQYYRAWQAAAKRLSQFERLTKQLSRL
jgi:hypothetical protein